MTGPACMPTERPQALQVADRFHLMLNLSAAIERVLEEPSRELLLPAVAEPSVPTPASPPPVAKLSVEQERKQQRRQRRLDRYEQAAELHKRGVSKLAISRQLSLGVKTVRRWLRADQFPNVNRQPVGVRRWPSL